MVIALKDPIGANLDRVQIVKGWLDKKGNTHEKVYDVAWSGDRQPGSDGKLAAGWKYRRYRKRHLGELHRLLRVGRGVADPDFDPEQSALYYARVLEFPRRVGWFTTPSGRNRITGRG